MRFSYLQGHIPTMLRTQYRCHPIISDLANSLFYQGHLLDGIQEADRKPVLVKTHHSFVHLHVHVHADKTPQYFTLYFCCFWQHITILYLLLLQTTHHDTVSLLLQTVYQHRFILTFVWSIIFQDILPTLCFYDVSNGQESSDSSGSFSNEKEADFVSFLIEVLLSAGVDAASIGVITLYKSQMYSILVKLGTSR